MLRELVAAALILGILGVVVWLGVTGILHIVLVMTALFLSLVLVRDPAAPTEKGSER